MTTHPRTARLHNALTALAFAAMLLVSSCGPGGPEERRQPAQAVEVRIVNPTRISSVAYANARLEGAEEATIYPGSPGTVLEVLVSEGDSVEPGQRLVRMDTDQQMSSSVQGAAASLRAARVNAENAQRDVERIRALNEAGAASQQELERAESARQAAMAQVQQAEAAYQQASTARRTAWITAPFQGRVVRIWASEGNMVSASPILSLASSSFLEARILLPEEDIYDLRRGLAAFVEVSALEGRAFPGTVVAVSEGVDRTTGLVPVRVRFDNEEGMLRPGMSGRIGVETRTVEDAVAIEESVLKRTRTGFQVAVVENGRAAIREVVTGISSDGMVQITSGLSPGDSLIVKGQNTLAQGDEVRLVD
jgi:membrane fusion protein (multidrug efflux system)/multidrug efflux system membrane fusion protein/cobalt-zinc-cadmium efflux system membrane fusion protein